MKYLIIGGSSGIGKAVAKHVLNGSHEVIIGGRKKNKLVLATNEMNKIGKSSFIQLDLSNIKSVNNAINEYIKKHKSIDGLVLNGPLPLLKPFETCNFSDWQKATNEIILSSVLIIKKLLPLFKRGCSIVFILSDTSRAAGVGKSISVSLRLGLSGLMKSLAIEYAKKGIRFNAVSPGPTNTERAKTLFKKGAKNNNKSLDIFKKEFTKNLPSKRLAEVDEVAELVYFLLCSSSISLTGANIPCDGALTSIPL
jgi:3-oxoacyl-[acyl-carrier protein] reductase